MIHTNLQFFGGRGTSGGKRTGERGSTSKGLSSQEIQDNVDVFDEAYGEIPKGSTINISYEAVGESVDAVITKKGEDEFDVKANGEKFKMNKEDVYESFIDGLWEDGVKVKTFDVVYKSKNAAVEAASYSHPATARGEEVYVMQKGKNYIITTKPKKYKGWKTVKME